MESIEEGFEASKVKKASDLSMADSMEHSEKNDETLVDRFDQVILDDQSEHIVSQKMLLARFLQDGSNEYFNLEDTGQSGVVDITTKSVVLFVLFASGFLFMLYMLMSFWFIEILVVLFCICGIEGFRYVIHWEEELDLEWEPFCLSKIREVYPDNVMLTFSVFPSLKVRQEHQALKVHSLEEKDKKNSTFNEIAPFCSFFWKMFLEKHKKYKAFIKTTATIYKKIHDGGLI